MQAFEQLESDLRRDGAGGSGASAGAFISRKKLVSVAVAGDVKCIAVKGRNARLLLRPHTSCNASERTRIRLAGGVINHSGRLQAPEGTGETSRVFRGLGGFLYKQPICGATSVRCLDLSLSLGSSVTLRFFFLQWMSATPDTTAVISSCCDFIVMSTGWTHFGPKSQPPPGQYFWPPAKKNQPPKAAREFF